MHAHDCATYSAAVSIVLYHLVHLTVFLLAYFDRSFVVKSYDDLRQERFVLQMAAIFDQVWADNHKLPLRLQAYSIVATGPDSGIIETIQNARSLDQVCIGQCVDFDAYVEAPANLKMIALVVQTDKKTAPR